MSWLPPYLLHPHHDESDDAMCDQDNNDSDKDVQEFKSDLEKRRLAARPSIEGLRAFESHAWGRACPKSGAIIEAVSVSIIN